MKSIAIPTNEYSNTKFGVVYTGGVPEIEERGFPKESVLITDFQTGKPIKKGDIVIRQIPIKDFLPGAFRFIPDIYRGGKKDNLLRVEQVQYNA